MKIAITGATGLLGRAVVAHALAGGHQVRALVRGRDGQPRRRRFDAVLAGDVEIVLGDLREQRTPEALLPGVDALVHAGLEHVPGRYRGGERDDPVGFVLANLTGSLELMRATLRRGVSRVVIISSRAVFDGLEVRYPATIPDSARPLPTTLYGACKAALEDAVALADAGARSGAVFCGLRPTGIYGVAAPVEASKWWDIVSAAVDGRPGDLEGGGTEVHVDDVAAAVLALLELPPDAVAGRIFNCSDVYVTRRSIAMLAGCPLGGRFAVACDPPALESSDPPPINLLDCAGLRTLGLEFRGWEGVREVVDQLRAAASRGSAQSKR